MSLIFVVFSFWAYIVQLIEGADISCTKMIGKCSDEEDCASQCNNYVRGVRVLGWSCSFFEICTCTFDRPIVTKQPTCEVGMGLCGHDCDNGCCNLKCFAKYPDTGVGHCVQAVNKNLCICYYNRWPYS